MESFYKRDIKLALKQNFSIFNNPKGNSMHSYMIEPVSIPLPLNTEPTQAEPSKISDSTTQIEIETRIRTELMRSIYAESDCV